MNGKGDKRRKGGNDKKYREEWERIFNKKKKDIEEKLNNE